MPVPFERVGEVRRAYGNSSFCPSRADSGGKCRSWWVTLKVWILFFVPEMGTVNKMHAITSNCFLENERIWGSLLSFCRLPHGFFALQNKNMPDWGPRRWRDFLWRGSRAAGSPFFLVGWEVSAWAVCTSPCIWRLAGPAGGLPGSVGVRLSGGEGREGRRRKGEVTGGGGGGRGWGCRGSCWAVMVMTRWKWRIFRNTIPAPDIPEAAAAAAASPGHLLQPRVPGSAPLRTPWES